MEWVVGSGSGMVLGGLLAVTLGMVSMRTGWTLPWVRRRVTRPRIYGIAGLLLGASCVIGVFYFHVVPSPSWEFRFFGTNALMFSGLIFGRRLGWCTTCRSLGRMPREQVGLVLRVGTPATLGRGRRLCCPSRPSLRR